MASNSSLISEDQFLCPICLGVFIQPVSTPCGHNFCMSCITSCWNQAVATQCPLCRETFERRPDLKVNTLISELMSQFMYLKMAYAHIWSSEQPQPTGTVLCDVCTDTQREAVKSCLECRTSYCDIHLELRGKKKHTLVSPVANLEDMICREHNRVLMLFCRKDKDLLCDVCASLRHVNHDLIPVQQAYKEMENLLKRGRGQSAEDPAKAAEGGRCEGVCGSKQKRNQRRHR